MRFSRDYELLVRRGARSVSIGPPFRIQFEAQKSTSGFGLNKLTGKVFGLGKETRHMFIKSVEESVRIPVTLRVGYAGRIGTVFSGDMNRGSLKLSKDGYEASFECFDGGFDYFNSYTAKSVTGRQSSLDAVLEDMPNTRKGAITSGEELVRPKILIGSSYQLLNDMAGPEESFFIDEGRANLIKNSEVIGSYVPLVDSSTGLISTPEREFSLVTFETLLNPYIKIGGRVKLVSSVVPQYNGTYRVDTITHKGDNEGSEWSQKVTGVQVKDVVQL